jgi:hypothetical protein
MSGAVSGAAEADSVDNQVSSRSPDVLPTERPGWVRRWHSIWQLLNSRWFKVMLILLVVVVTVIILEATNKSLTDIMFIGGIMGAISSVSYSGRLHNSSKCSEFSRLRS